MDANGKRAREHASAGSAAKKAKKNQAGPAAVRASKVRQDDPYEYLPGFGNEFCSEAVKDTLPVGVTTPQVCPKGLYAEQLSGTSFTTPRAHNQRTWFYRARPSVVHRPFQAAETSPDFCSDFSKAVAEPNQLRWNPFPMPAEGADVDFVQGLRTVSGAGAPDCKTGLAVHVYTANKSMGDRCLCNSDGDFLIVPQQGTLDIRTEFGLLSVAPGEICVIQRGMKFSVALEGPSRGYICEVFGSHFRIPDLGPIGANGLANPRDFMHPKAAFEDRDCSYTVVQKYLGRLWESEATHSPFNVVAWFGNYVPYKYDLARFVVVNSVSVDHLDPSIFTVLTAPTAEPGVAACDFAIFPPRYCVQDGTFRPPYYHRNTMSEFMGNIMGQYDAKPDGFQPGGASLHSCMIPHGPDANAFEGASNAALKPAYLDGALAFMFETTYMMRLTPWALRANVDKDYYKCWQGLKNHFREQHAKGEAGEDE